MKETGEVANVEIDDQSFSLAKPAWEKKIEVIRKMYASKATNEEFETFLYLAKRYGLDPLTKEIVFTKYETKDGPRASFITTRDGYLSIAQRTKGYMGPPLSAVVREGDEFEYDVPNLSVKHKFAKDMKRGKIIGAWAIVHRRGYNPSIAFAEYAEYNVPNSKTWSQYPSAMMLKVPESMVLKRQFGISGLVTAEEIGYEDNLSAITNVVVDTQTEQEDKVSTVEKMRRQFWATTKTAMLNNEEAHVMIKTETGKDSYNDMDDQDYDRTMRNMQERILIYRACEANKYIKERFEEELAKRGENFRLSHMKYEELEEMRANIVREAQANG
jgi:phage recombination protein Bet